MILNDGVNTGAISVVIPLGSKDDTAGLFPPSVISVWTVPTKKQQLHGTRAQDPLPPLERYIQPQISFKVMIYVKLVNYPNFAYFSMFEIEHGEILLTWPRADWSQSAPRTLALREFIQCGIFCVVSLFLDFTYSYL